MDQVNGDQALGVWEVEVRADTRNFKQEIAQASAYGQGFARSLGSAFEGVAFKGKSLGDAIRGVALSLSKMALTAAFKPLETGLANLFSNVAKGALGFANGGVVQSGMPVPFAAGGVIASPVAFPLAGGRTGIAGEAGAEAIMPLARGPDGRLGVRTQGGSALNVTFNVTTPDAESFRRSETQLAALLARAVGQGQRNL